MGITRRIGKDRAADGGTEQTRLFRTFEGAFSMKDDKWMIVMLKEKFNTENEKQQMYERLKNMYGKKPGEVYAFPKGTQ